MIHCAIDKKRWLHGAFGTSVSINPNIAASALISRVVDDYLHDVIAWLTQQHHERKKKRPRDTPGVGRNRLMLAALWIIDREVDQVNLIYTDILGGMAVLYGL